MFARLRRILLAAGGYPKPMEPRKVALGGLLLFLSSLTLIEARALSVQTPLYAAAVGSLALSVGSAVADIRQQDRPA